MKKIMIIIDTSRASGRKFLSGAERYISTVTDWEVYLLPPDYLQKAPSDLKSGLQFEKLDGLLVRDAVNSIKITNLDIPKVISDTQRELIPGISTIITDSEKIGQTAADYFVGLGFQHYAFCGFRELEWSQKRYEGYKKRLENHGIDSIHLFENQHSVHSQGLSERWRMSEWLKKLPHPVCIFACNDDRAISVLEACKTTCLSVPEEVAVLGVDNDELMCKLSSPSLSSIELDFERAGFAAAQHLNGLIEHTTEYTIIHVRPIEIVKRQSTDILAISDEDVLTALIFIRNNYDKAIQVTDVVNATCLSKRELEKRFKRIVKKTIMSEIKRLRIDLIKKKLLNTNQPIYQIANELEFTDPEHFSRYFKYATGLSPSQFKRNINGDDKQYRANI